MIVLRYIMNVFNVNSNYNVFLFNIILVTLISILYFNLLHFSIISYFPLPKNRIFFIFQEIMSLFASITIYFILTYYTIYLFFKLISNFFLFIVILVNETVLSIVNTLTLVIFCIFPIYTNKNLISLSSSIL